LALPRPEGKSSPVLAAFSVPKKKMKLAVNRHRIRRQMKEAWRLHKHELYNAIPPNMQLHVFFIYTHNALPEYAAIAAPMQQLIHRLMPGTKQ
jgi:ribonuclease P protein component